jgi:hypothetical protein
MVDKLISEAINIRQMAAAAIIELLASMPEWVALALFAACVIMIAAITCGVI